MSIRQTKKQSDLEKRLQLLRRQVYGKDSVNKQSLPSANAERQKASKSADSTSNPTYRYTDSPITNQPTDITYLHQDLFKILIFSSLAIGAQVVLFFLLQNHILKINFF